MDKEFVNEIRSHVNGLPVKKAKASRTKKMSRRGLLAIGAIIVSASLVLGGLLVMFGSLKQEISTEASILLDGIGDGSQQIITPVTGAHGGDIIKSDHTLESLSDAYISIDIVKVINEDDTPITQNEITSDLYAVTGAEGQLDYGSGNNQMTRIANQIDYSWTFGFQGALASTITLILAVENTNSLKVTYASSAWHYCTWNQGSSTWGNLIELTEGVRDTDSGIMTSAPDGNHKKISLLYGNAPEQFEWGWISTNNVPNTLTVPANWGGDGDVVNMVADGVSFSAITFPYLMNPHETLSFTERTELNPLITEGDYSVQYDFIPTV